MELCLRAWCSVLVTEARGVSSTKNAHVHAQRNTGVKIQKGGGVRMVGVS